MAQSAFSDFKTFYLVNSTTPTRLVTAGSWLPVSHGSGHLTRVEAASTALAPGPANEWVFPSGHEFRRDVTAHFTVEAS